VGGWVGGLVGGRGEGEGRVVVVVELITKNPSSSFTTEGLCGVQVFSSVGGDRQCLAL